ncbi:hypothetical protein GL213_14695 [Halogeometricum borinquense]|uniref:DUF8108 domain-containing protein n=1 Tax=Halogeometricum borinquense TaxID=60847 RepID=A0A6C0UCF0_9EURY|nr:hypothetical protein [Halogeometricum borinquense]QIB72976.1 hypothetical protein G3I44_00950 [Halogeometricum borinquense]QIQ77655.1 hypothetical protein GL213_14695 [Halogeometricum borinquense]
MRLRTELIAAVALFALLGALARTPAGRFVLPLVSLVVLVGFVYLMTRDTAYTRTTFGIRTRLLDSADGGDHDCTECGAPATTTRRFVREFVLLGVPVLLLDDGQNRYCDDCLP